METIKVLEALAKYQNSGASFIFTDCQIVLGDNAILGDILKKDTAHASTTLDIPIPKALLTFGMYLRQNMVIWSILFLTF